MELPRGLKARVPLAVFQDLNGTLPRPKVAAPPAKQEEPVFYTGADRATRLAAAIIGWNILRHFYPYVDEGGVDYDWMLAKTLRMAADQNADEFAQTLRWMVAQLRDGHGAVQYAPAKAQGKLPLAVEWIEGAWVVVGVGKGVEAKAGDKVVRVNGSEVSAQAEVVLPYVSGATPQWTHRIVARDMMRGAVGAGGNGGSKAAGQRGQFEGVDAVFGGCAVGCRCATGGESA